MISPDDIDSLRKKQLADDITRVNVVAAAAVIRDNELLVGELKIPRNASQMDDISVRPACANLPSFKKQPETRPVSQEQQAAAAKEIYVEVKDIYAGLVVIESNGSEFDSTRMPTAGKKSQPGNEECQALFALQRTLSDEHHDFFLGAHRASSSWTSQRLASQSAIPPRMWRHGIHCALELNLMLSFIYSAHSMISLLHEAVSAFEDAWPAFQSYLGCGITASEDYLERDRDICATISHDYYSEAHNKVPTKTNVDVDGGESSTSVSRLHEAASGNALLEDGNTRTADCLTDNCNPSNLIAHIWPVSKSGNGFDTRWRPNSRGVIFLIFIALFARAVNAAAIPNNKTPSDDTSFPLWRLIYPSLVAAASIAYIWMLSRWSSPGAWLEATTLALSFVAGVVLGDDGVPTFEKYM